MSKQNISGVFLLNKSYGLSSNTALQKTRRIFNAAKAGHTGTLDPLATGLLPICFGEATKFSSFLLDSDKEYIATVKLGIVTTTYDTEGEITSQNPVSNSKEEIMSCINSFLGKITQYPPLYSALKVNGRALYDYARAGEHVEVKSREVTIYELELLEFINQSEFKLRVLASKGTYIRSIAHDIGQKLGCGAHLSALVRTKTNCFNIEQAKTLEELSELSTQELGAALLPIDILTEHLISIRLSDSQYTKIKNGHSCQSTYTLPTDSPARLYYHDIFLGIATVTDNRLIKPLRLCNTSNL